VRVFAPLFTAKKESAYDHRGSRCAARLPRLKLAPVLSFVSRFQRADAPDRSDEHISSTAYGRDESLALSAQCLPEITYLHANV
jgi:hypothetical protein